MFVYFNMLTIVQTVSPTYTTSASWIQVIIWWTLTDVTALFINAGSVSAVVWILAFINICLVEDPRR